MPTFNLFTNLPKSAIPENFLSEATDFIANLLGKPKMYVSVRVVPDEMMSHGGTTDPCASVQLYSIGALGDRNKGHSAAIAEFLQKTLNLPQDRFYITFIDIGRNDCGYCGKTFAT